ncbi:hypothetical protein I3760_10G065600 [Carya illinoinensis]|nr:hypothetical protein I3760_10G065600 [Carya illinoinensis]
MYFYTTDLIFVNSQKTYTDGSVLLSNITN